VSNHRKPQHASSARQCPSLTPVLYRSLHTAASATSFSKPFDLSSVETLGRLRHMWMAC